MAKAIMIQGTMSNVGKSIITTGLCRIFAQDGFRVAPFKSQNMALNSYITDEGLEIGRAQAVQAEACGLAPSALMNPVLLKPTTDCGSQVIVNGLVRDNMTASQYFKYKSSLIPEIMAAYKRLAEDNDIIVIEGAGSPAEINLKENDIVNMGMARLAKAPVLLVGDIDPGGIFAQLAGTLMLLTNDEREMVKALIINKFRGDLKILSPGLDMLSSITNKPLAGVVPMLNLSIDQEDSLRACPGTKYKSVLEIAVISLPRMSNSTDFNPLETSPGVTVSYIKRPEDLKNPDLIILPGTKSTIADLLWLKESGFDESIILYARAGTPIIGICGGYQMLGKTITDSVGAEGGGIAQGLSLLPVSTVFSSQKRCTRVSGRIINSSGPLLALNGSYAEGYEIHMGETKLENNATPFLILDNGENDGCVNGNVLGTYLHGVFDNDELRKRLLFSLCDRRQIPRGSVAVESYNLRRQQEYDKLADALRQSLDIPMIYSILEAGI